MTACFYNEIVPYARSKPISWTFIHQLTCGSKEMQNTYVYIYTVNYNRKEITIKEKARVATPNGISISSAVSAWLTNVTNRPTDGPTNTTPMILCACVWQ